MIVFISGGCKNGKSSYAQRVARKLACDGKLYYVATMIPHDAEDEERVRRHIADRAGLGFETAECGTNILSCLKNADTRGTFLIDSATALLANEMFTSSGETDFSAAERCCAELSELLQSVKNAVVVSDYIFSDAAQYDNVTEAYRAGLARIDKEIARGADAVFELCAGTVTAHKGAVII